MKNINSCTLEGREKKSAWKNPKRLLIRFSAVFIGVTLYITFLASIAKAESLYSEKTITKMVDTCLETLSDDRPEAATARGKCIITLSAQFINLSPEQFNFSIGALLLEYEQTPKMRRAIKEIIRAVAENPLVKTELLTQNSSGQYWATITDDVLIGYSIAYVFAFGKGSIGAYKELKVAGESLTAWKRLRALLKAGLTETRISNPYRTAAIGVASFDIGMLHAIARERSIDNKKINPLDALDHLANRLVDSQCFDSVTAIESSLYRLETEPVSKVKMTDGAELLAKLTETGTDATQIYATVPSAQARVATCRGRIDNVTQRVKNLMGKVASASQKDESEFDEETQKLMGELEDEPKSFFSHFDADANAEWARQNMCAPPAPQSQICPLN